MRKLGTVDFEAINTLTKREIVGANGGSKTAAENTEQAILDHKGFLETLEEILSSDNKTSWDPNDMILD